MPLTKNQIKTIGECLRAAAYGPFFPDGEFDTIFGLSRSQIASVAEEWPIVIENAEIACSSGQFNKQLTWLSNQTGKTAGMG